jgi:hypothetical protein
MDSPNQRLAVALALSLLIHCVGYVTWRVAPAVASFAKAFIARAFPEYTPRRELAPAPKPPPPQQETALTFVEVDPALAAAEPPKETKNYSTHNSVAANPEPKKADVPKIDGTQTKILRVADNPAPQPKPLAPTPPKPEPRPEPKAEKPPEPEKAKPSQPIGDLAMAKTEPVKKPDTGSAATEQKRQRPRTLREVAQRNPSLAGQKTLQEGGVQRHGHISMVDAKASAFGEYDYAFIRAVEQRWYQLLDDNQYLLDRQGKVVLEFRLHFDGRISQMQVAENTVGDILSLLCQKAILDPAPFPKWPTPMRQAIHADYRDVRFTFYYD